MAKSGASKGAKKIKPFDEQNTKLAMGKIIKIPRVSIKEQIQSGKDLDYKADRKKHILIKKQHKKVDVRILFINANNKIYKGSKTTYGAWCTKHDILWCEKRIPREWLK